MSSQEMDLDSPSTPPPPPQNPQEFTPSTRISDLNEIDTSISTLLSSASQAIQILSGKGETNPSLSTIQTSFQTASQSYFSTLSSIEVRLRRQVYALEEAGLIPAGTERDSRRGRNLANEDGALSRRGGGGPLDPSWLNARVNNGVEEGKKRELLAQGRKFVEEEQGRGQDGEDEDEMKRRACNALSTGCMTACAQPSSEEARQIRHELYFS